MPEYNLGTARGRIVIETGEAERGLRKVADQHSKTVAKFRQQSYELRRAGLAFTAVAASAFSALGLAVNAARKFEKEISRFKAVTGASADEIIRVRKAALQLGTSTTIGATDAAGAIVELGKAGLRTGDILGGAAKATILLARAGELPLAEATLTVANAMFTFGLKAKDAVKIADTFAGAANASTVEVQDLATSLKFVGPAAIATKTSLDDVATALAIFGNRGLRGSIAGTALRGMLVRLEGPTKKAHDLLASLGIITKKGGNAFFDAHGKMKSLAEIAQILQDHTKKLTQEQRINTFYTLFGQRAMSAGIILADQGAEGFRKMAKEIHAVTAEAVSTEKLNNLNGDLLKLKALWQTALIKAGESFQKMLRGVVQRVIHAVEWFNKLSDGQRKLILQIVAIVGALAGFVGTMLLAASVVRRFQEAWAVLNVGKLIRLVLSWGRVLAGLPPVLAEVAAGQEAVAVAGAGIVGPVLLAVAAIGGLIYILSRFAGRAPTVKHGMKVLKDGLDDMASSSKALKEDTKILQDAVKNLRNRQVEYNEAQKKVNELRRDGRTHTKEYKDAVKDAAKAEKDLKAAQDDQAGAQIAVNKDRADQGKAKREQLAGLEEITQAIVNARSVFDGYNMEWAKNKLLLAENGGRQDDQTKGIISLAKQIDEGKVSLKTFNSVLDHSKNITGRQKDAVRNLLKVELARLKTQKTVASLVSGLTGVNLKTVDANAKLTDQYRVLNDTVDQYGAKNVNAKARQREYQRVVAETVAIVTNLGIRTTQAGESTVDVNARIVDSLKDLQRKYPALVPFIQTYIDELAIIPPKKGTQVEINAPNPSKSDPRSPESWIDRLASIPGGPIVSLAQFVVQGLDDLNAYLNALSKLPGHSTLAGGYGPGGQFTGRKKGKQFGGRVHKNVVYRVGEHGPEEVAFSREAWVANNAAMRSEAQRRDAVKMPSSGAAAATALTAPASSLAGVAVHGSLDWSDRDHVILRGIVAEEIHEDARFARQVASHRGGRR